MSKVAIITGASSGIGAAVALRLAGKYDAIVLHARHSKGTLNRVGERVRELGSEVKLVMGDLVDSAVPVAIVDAALEFGRLDCLVANAGFPILKSLSEGSDEEIEYAFRGNVISFFGLVRHALPLLQRAEHPRVVAVGSYTSHIFRNDVRSFPMSASSKGALEVAVRSLAIDLAPRGITVNCVVPGLIAKDEGTADALPETELRSCIGQIPLGRVGRPDDVAGAIQFFLSPEASYITGQLLHVNGGLVI